MISLSLITPLFEKLQILNLEEGHISKLEAVLKNVSNLILNFYMEHPIYLVNKIEGFRVILIFLEYLLLIS